jgi:hypothetical protein
VPIWNHENTSKSPLLPICRWRVHILKRNMSYEMYSGSVRTFHFSYVRSKCQPFGLDEQHRYPILKTEKVKKHVFLTQHAQNPYIQWIWLYIRIHHKITKILVFFWHLYHYPVTKYNFSKFLRLDFLLQFDNGLLWPYFHFSCSNRQHFYRHIFYKAFLLRKIHNIGYFEIVSVSKWRRPETTKFCYVST